MMARRCRGLRVLRARFYRQIPTRGRELMVITVLR